MLAEKNGSITTFADGLKDRILVNAAVIKALLADDHFVPLLRLLTTLEENGAVCLPFRTIQNQVSFAHATNLASFQGVVSHNAL